MGGEPTHVLHRIDQRALHCALLPMPIDDSLYRVQEISESPLVVCLRSDDPIAAHAKLDI